MAQTRFRTILQEYSRLALADPQQHAVPLRRLAWNKLMGVWGMLAHAPVWNARPVLLEGWRTQQIRVPQIDELQALGAGLALVHNAGNLVAAETLAGWLWEALLWCSSAKMPEVVRQFTPRFVSHADWALQVQFQRKPLIEELAGLAVPGLEALLLQGSLADGLVVEGYSDCDVIVLLDIAGSAEGFCQQISAVMRMNGLLLAYQPLMHHGPQVFFKQALGWATEAALPSAVLSHSVLLQGRGFQVGYINGDLEAGQTFDIFEQFFERHFARSADIQTAFDALWWSATVTILPLLAHQLRERQSVWKRDLLTGMDEPLIHRMTETRLRLGEWLAPRLASDNWPDRGLLNPGVAVSHHKQSLRLAGAEVGLDDAVITMGRSYLCSIAADCFELNYKQVFARKPASFATWPRGVQHRPLPVAHSEYDDLRQSWVRWAAVNPHVAAVYEFGAVGCPGLSDLDLLFVLGEGADPSSFSMSSLSLRQQYLMGHDAQLVPRRGVEHFSYICPMMSLSHLSGDEFGLLGAAQLPADTLAAALTAYNCRKYPGDLLDLGERDTVDFRTLLAFLHSFGHIATGLALIGSEVPASIAQCVELDAQLRAEFLEQGSLLSGELGPAMSLMLAASAAMLHAFEQYWVRRLPWLKELAATSSIAEISTRIEAARAGKNARAVGLAPLLDLVSCYLADSESDPWIDSVRLRELLSVVAEYRLHKRAYVAASRAAGLPIDVYLADPRFLEGADAVKRRFQFEAACGHGVGALPLCEWGQAISFDDRSDGRRLQVAGWSTAEDWGTWALGPEALLLFRLPERATCRVVMQGQAFFCEQHPSQVVRLRGNGKLLAEWQFQWGKPLPQLEALVDADVLLASGPLLLSLELPDAVSPDALGLYADQRVLGLGLQQMIFQRVQ